MRKQEDIQERSIVGGQIVPVLTGGGFTIILIVLLLVLFAIGIWTGILAIDWSDRILPLCAGVSSFLGGRIAVKKGRGKPILLGLCTGILVSVILFLLGMIGAETRAVASLNLTVLLTTLIGGCLAGLLGNKKNKRKRRK